MKTLFKLSIMFVLTMPTTLPADVWELAGNWVYRFRAREGSFSVYENKSYSIGVERELSDGTVIGRIEARLKPFYRGVPLGECVGSDGKPVSYELRSFYVGDEEKRKRFLAEAKKLIGEHETVESAVEAIAFWIRANVYYQLGTASDPLGVLKAKRAFCEGYANLMVEFLLAYGIEARVLSCYIPSGKGWGTGGSGGSGGTGGFHAFVEYWYPGYGGVMCDPQSTLNYVDPYHILGFSRDTRDFLGDVSDEITEGYVAGLRKGLVSWDTFSMSAQSPARGFVPTLFRTPEGGLEAASLVSCTANGEESTWLAEELAKKRSLSSLINSNEFFYYKQLRYEDKAPGYYVLWPPKATGGKASAKAIFIGGSAIYEASIDVECPGYHAIIAEPYADSEALRAVFLDARGYPLVAVKAKVTIDGTSYDLSTDRSGSILVARPWTSLSFTISGALFEVQAGARGVQRFALVEQAPASPKPAATPSPRPLGPNDLAIVAIDPLGNANPAWFESVELYSQGGKRSQGKKDASGSWVFASALEKKPSHYVVVARAGNRYVRREIEHESGPLLVEIRDDLKAGIALESEFPRNERDFFFEYWEASQIAYQGAKPRVDGLPSSFWLSDEAKGRYMHRVTPEEAKASVLFKRFEYSHDEYVEMRRKGQKDATWLSGFINGYLSRSVSADEYTITFKRKARIKSGSLSLYDESDLSLRALTIDEFGYFYCQGLKPGAYLALSYDTGNVLATRFTLVEGDNRLVLDMDGPAIDYESYAKELYLALPKKGKQGPEADFVRVGSKLSYYKRPSFYLSSGEWWIGDAPCYGALTRIVVLPDGSVEGGNKKDETTIAVIPRSGEHSEEEAASILSAFSLNAAEGNLAFFVRVQGDYGAPLESVGFTIRYGEKGEYRGMIDARGLGFVRIPDCEKFSLFLQQKGILIDTSFNKAMAAKGLLSIDPIASSAVFLFSRKPSLTVLSPVQTEAQGFDWVKTKCDFKYERLLVVSDKAKLYFESPEGTGVKSFDNIRGKTQSIGFAVMPDQFQIKRDVLFELYKDRPLVVARFTGPSGPLASMKASFTQATSSVQGTTCKDGLISFVNPFSDEPVLLECKADGFFARKNVTIGKKAVPLELTLDAARLATVTLSVAGLAKGKTASLALYPGAKLEKGKIANAKEKIGLSTDASGKLFLALNPGDYVIEYGKEAKAFTLGAKALSLSLQAAK